MKEVERTGRTDLSASRSTAGQTGNAAHLLLTPWRQDTTVHRRVHKNPPTVPILSQMNPLHTSPANLLKIHSDSVSHLRLGLPSRLFPSGFPTKTLYTFLSHECHMSRPRNSPGLNLPSDIWEWVQIMKLLIVQLPPFSCYFIPLRTKYHPQNAVLKHHQCGRPRFTPKQNRHNYGFVYCNLYIPKQQAEDSEPNGSKHSPNLVCS
jgi:hypothetical protein